MKLDKTDMIRLCTYSTIGAIVGVFYELVIITAQRKLGCNLIVPTNSINNDRSLLAKLYQLELRIHNIDEIAYLRLVDTIDQLLFLRQQLESGKITYGNPEQHVHAISLFAIILLISD